MASYLITAIQSALQYLDLIGRYVFWETTYAALSLKIELRNVKVQLLCLGDTEHKSSTLFPRIEDAIGSILLQEMPPRLDRSTFSEWVDGDILYDLSSFGKQLADEWNSSPLAVDEVVGIVDSILENVADFLVIVQGDTWAKVLRCVEVDLFDAIEAQLTFLKGMLVFAKGTGVELQHLLNQIQPSAINAAHLFISNQPSQWYGDRYEEILLKCSTLIGIATAPQVYQAYTQALSTSTFSSTPSQYADTDDGNSLYNLKNFLDSLISLLWDVLRHHPDSRIKDQLKVLYERLRFCRAILKQQQRSFDWKMMDQIGVLLRGAGMLVCSLHHMHVDISYPERLSELLERFGVLQIQLGNGASELRAPKAEELGLCDSAYIMEDIMISDGNEETAMSGHEPQRSSSPPQIVGFQYDEVTSILDRLTRGSKQLQIVPICGVAGLGKTTFASAVYNHRSNIYHFQARAWCTISQVLDTKRVMLQLLNQLIPESRSFSEMTGDDLANKLRQSLKHKRYLIVLDDVWTTEAWQSLAASFPDDSTQSRVILTSRHHNIVSHALPNQQPHLLRLREDSECLEILQRQLSHKRGWTSEIGMTVATMCKGLPLTVVIVAGLLGTTEQQGWKTILDHLNSSGVSGEKQCNSAFELSFRHLPNDLKLCFLYFAAFPEDEEISVKRLLRLWTAEGFVRPNELKRVEHVA